MTITVKREALHHIIEDLPEPQLFEVAKFIESLLAQSGPEAAAVELWTETADPPAGLSEVIRAIKNTPPNDQAVTLPAKTWAEFAAEITQGADNRLDVAAWNQGWDALEAEMEAASLAHEALERREQRA